MQTDKIPLEVELAVAFPPSPPASSQSTSPASTGRVPLTSSPLPPLPPEAEMRSEASAPDPPAPPATVNVTWETPAGTVQSLAAPVVPLAETETVPD